MSPEIPETGREGGGPVEADRRSGNEVAVHLLPSCRGGGGSVREDEVEFSELHPPKK